MTKNTMQTDNLIFLLREIFLVALGVLLLRYPNPKYMPKLSYRLLMKDMSEEHSIQFTKFYAGACFAVGILFLILYLLAFTGVIQL